METQTEVTLDESREIVVNLPDDRVAFLTLEGRTLWVSDRDGIKVHGIDLGILPPR